MLFTPQAIVNGSDNIVGTKLVNALSDPLYVPAFSACQQVSLDLEVSEGEGGSIVATPSIQRRHLARSGCTVVTLVMLVVDEGAC